jgi:hypothetical protein
MTNIKVCGGYGKWFAYDGRCRSEMLYGPHQTTITIGWEKGYNFIRDVGATFGKTPFEAVYRFEKAIRKIEEFKK